MSALFRCVDIGKQYGGLVALQGISLSLEVGRVHGLIGPNGAGKSTFIDVVSGRTPGTGHVYLDDRDITRVPLSERRRMGVSRSFQRTSIFPALTIREQLDIAAHGAGGGHTGELTDMLGLADVLDARAEEVSYGQQRLVDLALALVGNPRVLLLDEPAAGLSVAESQTLAAHLEEVAARWKVAVLLVEHDMDVVFRVCHVLTVLASGRWLVAGPPDEVRSDPAVIGAYFGSAA
ncbi:ATP-binding cassette domain-containing protein [Xanthobacter dioxanivorans]|uniref:ATP-binding cassette domain-containing protein n=1 Tax=Xanthobacter dioxanivorans TaxID=2528964 RepID=A0A974PTM5_9HYPH|nr:ATP-binding cassette domain-containing protein [Xanthobacter dioxanivorans]QRG09033.1 ATP-binding cassette domain-containing protein [Xanthobacter dioxanivorans]